MGVVLSGKSIHSARWDETNGGSAVITAQPCTERFRIVPSDL